jgi:hypothetical protein
VPSGGKPGPSNTGVPAGTALTVISGNQTFTSGVHSGLDIHGIVTISGSNVTLKDSIVRGPDTASGCSDTGLIKVTGSGNTVEDVEVAPTAATACTDGIWASGVTVLRVNIHGTVDGMKADSNTTVQDSYIHDLHVFASDPNQGGGATHNDAVQTFTAGSNITLNHNFFNMVGSDNSAYQLTQDEGVAAKNIKIENNWLNGGGCTLNLSSKGAAAITAANGIYVQSNRFGQGTSSYSNCPVLLSLNFALAAFTGNVWDGSGAAIPNPQQHN